MTLYVRYVAIAVYVLLLPVFTFLYMRYNYNISLHKVKYWLKTEKSAVYF